MERRSRTSGYAERRQVELMQRNTSKPRTASKRPTPRAVSPPTRLGERLSTVVPAKAGEKLSVVEKNIAELDPVQAHQVKTKILFISGNMLSTLQGLQQFTNLRTLSAASNYLTSFEALAALSDLTKLEVLNLQNNPVTQLPYYRLRMVSMCPRLTSLDNKEVGSRERTTASEVLRKEDEMLSTMYCQHTLIVKMSSVLSKMRLHEEFRAILESRGGPRQQPSKVSLDLFLISGAELSVWYMPPEDIVPVLRKQVRRVRLVKMAANNSDKDVDSVHGWDAAYRQVADEQKSFTTSLLSELQQAMSRLYGTPLKDAGDAMVLTAFKELVAALTTKHIKNDLLEDWKYRSSSAVTSPTSLPPQQADPGTPNDHELLLSARERQAKAEELHKNRLAKTRARDIPSQPPTFMQTAHKVSPRSMSISSQSRQRVEEIEGTDSLSPHSMSLMDPQEASEGGVTQEDLAQHIQDEVKLQQVNTALRLKLEEFQRVNAKNASTAKHYKSQLQEALKREASLREELDEMMEVHSEEVAALKHALIQLEENKAQSEASVMAQIENMRVHEVRLEELERAHETITTLQRDCDYLRQKVTQYRDEVRQRSVQREEVQQVESCPEEAIIMGNRCLMRRVFGRLVSATMPLAAKRNACYLLKDVSCMASVRTVMVQWKYLARKDAFVEKGHSRMVRSVREHYFRKWFEATCKRVLSGKRRQMDTAWNHWVMRTHQRQLSRSTGSGSSTPVARETTPAPTPLPSPARMPPGLRRQKPVRQEEDSDSDHIDPAGRVYNPVEGHTRVVLRKGLTTKIRKGRGVDLHQADRFEGNSEGDGDYITPPIKGKRSQQDLLAQQEMFRRWQMYCRGQKKKGRSITAMRHYTSQLKANTFTEWRQASKRQIAERRSIVSDFFSAWRKESHMSKQRCLNRRMADGMRRVHDTRLVEGMMVHWIRKTRHRLLLHRLEDYAAEKFKKDRLRAALGRWKAASIKRMIQLRHQKEQLEAEVQAHKDKVTTLGLSNIKLVDELSEAMNKAVDLEVDLEARSSELRDMTTSLASCQASKRALTSKLLGVQNECKERDIKLNVMREEVMLSEHKVTQHHARLLLAEQGASKTIEELSLELKEKQGGINMLHQQLRGTQRQLDVAHETGSATTNAMLKLTSQLRKTVKEQEEMICSLDVERAQQDKAQEAFQKELLSAQQKIAEGQQERNAFIRQQQEKMHNLRLQVSRSEMALDKQKAETSAHSFHVQKLQHELALLEEAAAGVGTAGDSDSSPPRSVHQSYAHTDTSGEVEELLRRARAAKEQLAQRESNLRKQGAEALIRSSAQGVYTPSGKDVTDS